MRQIVPKYKNSLKINQEKWLSILKIFLFIFVGLVIFFSLGNLADERNQIPPNNPADTTPTIQSCDYLLKNGTIVDGTGTKSYVGDVAIKESKIIAVGKFKVLESAKVIDVTGKIIAPGFIDIHTHTENYWITSPKGEMTLAQGITTHIAGNCGTSVDSVPEYLAQIDEKGSAVNVGLFTGYSRLRRDVGVAATSRTTEDQISKMQDLLKASIEGGSFGLSVGLGYAPQNMATTDELKELAKTVKAEDGLMAMHIRNEGNRVVESLAEAIDIAKTTGVRFEYSHAKAAGKNNWSKVPKLLKMLEEAQAEGVDIMTDVYVYGFSSNDLYSDTYFSSSEDNIKLVLKHPLTMVASDGGLQSRGIAVHPRVCGNVTRVLTKYVRDEKVLSLESAIHKMTEMPAERLKINDRGVLKAGNQADVVVFDLNNLKENATRNEPNRLSEGMSYVFVNGVVAIDNGSFTGNKGGVALYSSKDKPY